MKKIDLQQYKKPPINFGKTEKIKDSLADEQRKRRRTRRTLDFEENRKELGKESSPCSTVSQNDDPKTKLLQWRAERKRIKKETVSQKKPPFVVGIVRHQIYSPVSSTDDKSTVGARKEKKKIVAQGHNTIKGITKATEKRLLAKAKKNDLKQSLATSVQATTDQEPRSIEAITLKICVTPEQTPRMSPIGKSERLVRSKSLRVEEKTNSGTPNLKHDVRNSSSKMTPSTDLSIKIKASLDVPNRFKIEIISPTTLT